MVSPTTSPSGQWATVVRAVSHRSQYIIALAATRMTASPFKVTQQRRVFFQTLPRSTPTLRSRALEFRCLAISHGRTLARILYKVRSRALANNPIGQFYFPRRGNLGNFRQGTTLQRDERRSFRRPRGPAEARERQMSDFRYNRSIALGRATRRSQAQREYRCELPSGSGGGSDALRSVCRRPSLPGRQCRSLLGDWANKKHSHDYIPAPDCLGTHRRGQMHDSFQGAILCRSFGSLLYSGPLPTMRSSRRGILCAAARPPEAQGHKPLSWDKHGTRSRTVKPLLIGPQRDLPETSEPRH